MAIESSTVTLISGELEGVVTAIALTRATMRNVRENLVFAVRYNTVGLRSPPVCGTPSSGSCCRS